MDGTAQNNPGAGDGDGADITLEQIENLVETLILRIAALLLYCVDHPHSTWGAPARWEEYHAFLPGLFRIQDFVRRERRLAAEHAGDTAFATEGEVEGPGELWDLLVRMGRGLAAVERML